MRWNGKAYRYPLRYVGLPESLDFIAAAMNWHPDKNSESPEPILAVRKITNVLKSLYSGVPAIVLQAGPKKLAGHPGAWILS